MKKHHPNSNRFALNAFGALSLAAVLLTGAAQAATVFVSVPFTVSGSNALSFSKFDTSLGTLTGISLSWTANSGIESSYITNSGLGTVTWDRSTFTADFNAYLPGVDTSGNLSASDVRTLSHNPSGTRSIASGQTYNTPSVLNFTQFTAGSTLTAGDESFNSFKGAGTVPLFLTSNFGITPVATGAGAGTSTWTTSVTGSTSGSLGVTYTYEVAAVPEPSDLLLCAAPVLLGGAGLMRRNRKSRKQLA